MEEFIESENIQEVAEPVENEVQVESDVSENGEVADSTSDGKQVQDSETNSKFASIRREMEAKAKAEAQTLIDKEYETLYSEYGIHSKAEYEAAIKRQEEENIRQQYSEKGIDYEEIKKLIDENPIVKQAQELLTKQQEEKKFADEAEELFKEFPDLDVKKIPDEVLLERANKGVPLVYAYARYASKNALKIAEQRAIQNINKNSTTTAGSLSGGETPVQPLTEESISKMSNKEQMARWNEIKKFYGMK